MGNKIAFFIFRFLSVCVCLNGTFHLNAAGNFKHIPGIFVGITDAKGIETEFTYALEYEYKFSQSWGIGVLHERIDGAKNDKGVRLNIAQLFYHPNDYWKLGIGIGEERINGDKVKYKDITRASLAHEIYIGDFILAPTIAIDFIEDGDEAWVIGVALERPF